MPGMRPAHRVLVHQVHPAKVGADVTASLASNVLLWQARPKAAIAVRVLLPLAGSAAVLRFADLDALARTGRGRYVLAHMPPTAQGVRLAGDAAMGLGAYRHRWALIIAGAAVVVAGWSHAVWPSGAGRGRPGAARRSRRTRCASPTQGDAPGRERGWTSGVPERGQRPRALRNCREAP